MKYIRSKCFVVLTLMFSILLVTSFDLSSGTGWVTIFGKDYGASISNGNLNISVGMGGFYHWWEAFAEREYKPRDFGAGYDDAESLNSDLRLFPSVVSPKEGWPSTLVFPIWIIVTLLLVAASLSIVYRRKQEAEPQR